MMPYICLMILELGSPAKNCGIEISASEESLPGFCGSEEW